MSQYESITNKNIDLAYFQMTDFHALCIFDATILIIA